MAMPSAEDLAKAKHKLMQLSSFEIEKPSGVKTEPGTDDLYADRYVSVFWVFAVIQYRQSVLPIITGQNKEIYTLSDLDGFLHDCRRFVQAKVRKLPSDRRENCEHMGGDWLMDDSDPVVYFALVKTYWRVFYASIDAKDCRVSDDRLRKLMTTLACYTALVLISDPPERVEQIYSQSIAFANEVKTSQPHDEEFGIQCQNAAMAWIDGVREIQDHILEWIQEARPRPKQTAPRVKAEHKPRRRSRPPSRVKYEEPEDSGTWQTPLTPCYLKRLEASRLDPFSHGLAFSRAPIQLLMLVDPEDGGINCNHTHLADRLLPLPRQTVPEVPALLSPHPFVASYQAFHQESSGLPLCGHLNTDNKELLIEVLITENVPPNRTPKAIDPWIRRGDVDVCSPDVTKNVNLRGSTQLDPKKRAHPGKGNTASGAKSQVADHLKKQVEKTFQRWLTVSEERPDQSPVVKLMFHPTSTQSAYIFALSFAYRYVISRAKSDHQRDPESQQYVRVVQALVTESLWQKELNATLIDLFRDLVRMHAIVLFRSQTHVLPAAHCPGCPLAYYSDRMKAALQKLDPAVLLSSADSRVDATADTHEWWPLMMTKKSVCRTWSDDLNRYRAAQLDISDKHPDFKQKLTASDVTLATSKSCICEGVRQLTFRDNPIATRDGFYERLARQMLPEPDGTGFAYLCEWYYYNMHPQLWTAAAVEQRLRGEVKVPEGVPNVLAFMTFQLYCLAWPFIAEHWPEWKERKRASLSAQWAERAGTERFMPLVEVLHLEGDDAHEDAGDDYAAESDTEEAPLDPPLPGDEREIKRVRVAPAVAPRRESRRCKVDELSIQYESGEEQRVEELVRRVELLASCPSTHLLAEVYDLVVVQHPRLRWHSWRDRMPNTAQLALRFAQDREEARRLHFRLMGYSYHE